MAMDTHPTLLPELWDPLPPEVGVYTATLTVTDDDGGAGTDTLDVTVEPLNRPPVARAGGPYRTWEGIAVTLDGRGASDPDGDPLTYAWDLDGDGQFDDSTSPQPSVQFVDHGTYTIALQVSDGTETASTTTAVHVVNVAPEVEAIADQTVNDGSAFLLSATFSDPGQDTQTVVIDWGDGSRETQTLPPEAQGQMTASHTYADDGVFAVTLSVTDDSGGTDTQTFKVTVNNVVPVAEAGGDQTAIEGGVVSFVGGSIR